MTLTTAILKTLKAISELTVIVGAKIYSGIAPEGTTASYVCIYEVESQRHHDLDVGYPVYQFSCFSTSYEQSKLMAQLIRYAFQRYKGTLGGAGGVSVIQGVYENETYVYEPDTKLHHVAVNIKFLHRSQ